MTQKIDPIKLKAAAEHLEWVCQQYPNEERVQSLLEGMRSLIDDAKACKVEKPFADEHRFPSQWSVFAEGLYRDYRDPNVEGAYGEFTDELRGGLTEDDKEIEALIEQLRNKRLAGNGGRL